VVLSRHVAEHNHPLLSLSCAEKREWNSHSKIEQCVKDMIRFLRENNVSLSRVHCIMGSMFGSMGNVPFNQKSLRAVCVEIARDHKDDDVAKTLEVFRKMRAEDPGFQFSVQLDEDRKIKTLSWTSGRSRSQHTYFGDAITFDTTYCTNLYKMPFGMGVNNHFQFVIFAGVLMRDETAESFKWVFNEFLSLMGGKSTHNHIDRFVIYKAPPNTLLPMTTSFHFHHSMYYGSTLLHPILKREPNAPGSSSTHMIDVTSVYPKQCNNEIEYHSTLLHDRQS
jgi:hypothetical protein